MRFIHVPRTGGLTIASQIGTDTDHRPARAFPDEGTFAVVRDPYARAVSMFASEVNGGENLPVDLFEQWVLDRMLIEVVNKGTEWEMSFAAPQCCFVGESTEVFRYEYFAAVVEGVFRHTRVMMDNRALHKTHHFATWQYYADARVRAVIAERYRIDFDRFRYDITSQDR